MYTPHIKFEKPSKWIIGDRVSAVGQIYRTRWVAIRETMDPLLGRPMDPELAADIDRLVLDHPYILGIHDQY